jgi:hypothetical protein
MWFEYNGYVYDTMPGMPLRRIAASPQSRLRPPSEVQAFAANLVGSAPFSLTESQHRLVTGMNGAAIAWLVGNVANRQVDSYTP